MTANDTDPTHAPSSVRTVTDPGLGQNRTDPDPMALDAEAPHEVSPPVLPEEEALADAILGKLRKDRAPPKVAPAIRAQSQGEVAEAYAASAHSVPPRHATPTPEPAVQIRRPSISTTVRRERDALTLTSEPPGTPRKLASWRFYALLGLGAAACLTLVAVVALARVGDRSRNVSTTAPVQTPTAAQIPAASSVRPPLPDPTPITTPSASAAHTRTAPPLRPLVTPATAAKPRPQAPKLSAPSAPPPVNTGFEREF